jgi:protein-disulfide isomerase
MIPTITRDKLLKFIILAGLCIAILSAIESRVEWLASLCNFWGRGCSETEHITFLKLSISFWGIGYYLVLALLFFYVRNWVFYLVMGGAGFEMILISMMIEMKLVCVYCFLNLIVVVLLVICSFKKERIWQALALTFFIFMVSDHLLSARSAKAVGRQPKPVENSIVATIGDHQIRARELDVALSSQIYKLEYQIYDLKKRRLDYLINTRLIEMDAKAKGLSPDVVTFQVLSQGLDVTDADVDQYYQENKDNISMGSMTLDQLKDRIKNYLKEKKTTEKIEAYTKPLKEKYNVSVFLSPPDLPMTSVSEGSSPALGPADAAVTVVEYSDYECPSCRKNHEIIKKIREKFQGKIRWVFKDFPLDRHKDSKYMAEAARCAGEQGRFWEFQDLMYTTDSNPDLALMKQDAQSLNLNVNQFSECLESGRNLAVIDKDKQDAKESGVSSTPTFIINGRLRPGYITFETFSDLIQHDLDKGL